MSIKQAIEQLNADGRVVCLSTSAACAARTSEKVMGKMSSSHIIECCRHPEKHKTYKGYRWRYAAIDKYSLDGKTLLKRYTTVEEASKDTGINANDIRNAAFGKYDEPPFSVYGSHSTGGYKWRFACCTKWALNDAKRELKYWMREKRLSYR